MLRWNLTNLWQKKKFLTTPLLFRTFSVIKHNTSNKINVNFLNFGWISSIQPKRTVKRGLLLIIFLSCIDNLIALCLTSGWFNKALSFEIS